MPVVDAPPNKLLEPEDGAGLVGLPNNPPPAFGVESVAVPTVAF